MKSWGGAPHLHVSRPSGSEIQSLGPNLNLTKTDDTENEDDFGDGDDNDDGCGGGDDVFP